jgi:excinuclease ABC subunit A
LHFADIHKLLEVLQRLVKLGNSVLVIEHNLDVIKTADYLIDLGPEGGDRGGTVIASGTPEEVAANDASYTGHYLVPVLRDQRAVGHHLPDDAEQSRLEQQNLLVLDDLAKSDRIPIEA